MIPIKVAYLASPIDRGNHPLIEVAREVVLQNLGSRGVAVYQPHHAWHVSDPNQWAARHLWLVNEEARRGSDLVVAIISADVCSIGVPAEVALSISEGLTVILLLADASAPRNSWVMAAWDEELRSREAGGVMTIQQFITWAGRLNQ